MFKLCARVRLLQTHLNSACDTAHHTNENAGFTERLRIWKIQLGDKCFGCGGDEASGPALQLQLREFEFREAEKLRRSLDVRAPRVEQERDEDELARARNILQDYCGVVMSETCYLYFFSEVVIACKEFTE
jgi:hypothetical protein